MADPPVPKAEKTNPDELSIDSIKVPHLPEPSAYVKKFTQLEENFYIVHTAGIEQDIKERKKYAHRIFCLISAWLISIFILLIVDGLGKYLGFSLTDAVMLAVIGSTTVNVLGIFYIVTHYLFPQR
jgi:hypothetical protein